MRSAIIAAAIGGLLAGPALAGDIQYPSIPLPALAAKPGPQGYVGVYGGAVFSAGVTYPALHADGAANFPLGGGPLNLEIEGRTYSIFNASGAGVTFSMPAVTGHLSTRLSAFSVGVFGGYEALAISSSPIDVWHLGVEAQAYVRGFTLTGQVSNMNLQTGGTSVNSLALRGGVQLYFTDNFYVGVDARAINRILGSTTTEWIVAGTGELRLGASPWSGYATVRYLSLPVTSSNSTTALFGLRGHLGSRSLRDQYTNGATWNTLPFLF